MPDVVKAAIDRYVPSEGNFLAKVNHQSPSIIYFWGVRLDTKPEADWVFDKNNPRERY